MSQDKDHYVVCVKVELFYAIPKDDLPAWVDDIGVERLVDAAIDNHRFDKIEDFGINGHLKMEPIEIAISSVMSA